MIRNTSRRPSLIAASLLFCTVSADRAVAAPPTFEAVEIQHPTGRDISPRDINDANHVCGHYLDAGFARKPFLWMDGQFIDLADIALDPSHSVSATSINNFGQVAGSYNSLTGDPPPHQFWLWTDLDSDLAVDAGEVQYIALPDIATDPDGNSVNSMNDAGHFVGRIPGTEDDGPVAYFWDGADYTIITHGEDLVDEAVTINNLDQVGVTAEDLSFRTFQSFRWTPSGETPLENCGGQIGGTFVRAINERGHLVGECIDQNVEEPVLFLSADDYGLPAGTHLIDPNGDEGRARDLNDAGWIVGNREGFAATLWIPNNTTGFDVHDLGDLAGLGLGELRSGREVSNSFGILASDLDGRQYILRPSGDRDGDGLLDVWETNGLDINGDSIVDLDFPAMGADPDHKDLFLEVDIMENVPLINDAIEDVVVAFDFAPVENPDGVNGIRLHIDLSTADTIPFEDSWDRDMVRFGQVKPQFFGTSDERDNVNSEFILEAKKRTFRYCTIVNKIINGSGKRALGVAERPGDDMMVAVGSLAGDRDVQGSTFMHEFGHNLNLQHGGFESANYKPNHVSVMNYGFDDYETTEGEPLALDFSSEVMSPLAEQELNENNGIVSIQNSDVLVFYGTDDGSGGRQIHWVELSSAPYDWNHDGTIDNSVPVDLNFVGPGYPDGNTAGFDVFLGVDEWALIQLPLGTTGNFADRVHQAPPFVEKTVEDLIFMRENLPAPPVNLAILNDAQLAHGTLLDGNVDALATSDNAYLTLGSQFGFSVTEPYLIDVIVQATTDVTAPTRLALTVEGKLDHPGGHTRLRLFNWITQQFDDVAEYGIGRTETTNSFKDIDPTDRIRESDGRIDVSIRQSVLATFTVAGFRSMLDRVEISVRDN